MKKIKINEMIFNIFILVFLLGLLGSLFSGVLAILGFEVPSKTQGVIKYNFYDGIYILFSSFVILTIIYFFSRIFEPIKNSKNLEFNFSICPKCNETFNSNELKNGKCKYCEDTDTVDIEKYYENNPENEEDK